MIINVPNTIRRLDHLRTYQRDDIVAISLLRREVATKNRPQVKRTDDYSFRYFRLTRKPRFRTH